MRTSSFSSGVDKWSLSSATVASSFSPASFALSRAAPNIARWQTAKPRYCFLSLPQPEIPATSSTRRSPLQTAFQYDHPARQELGSFGWRLVITEVGQIEAIFRYPVKSMAGERVESADLG